MDEQFVGGVASVGVTRIAHGIKSSFYVQTGGPVGYGIYLTDRRLVGVTYKKTASRAYRPAFILLLVWIVSLVCLVVYALATGAEELPPIPFVMGLAVVDLFLLLYLSPRRAQQLVEREGTIKSIEELQKLVPEVAIDRDDILQIEIRPGKIDVITRFGQAYYFLWRLRKGKSELLLRMLQVFSSMIPMIELTLSDRSGKNQQKLVEPTSADRREGWVTFQRPDSTQPDRLWTPRKLTFEEAQKLGDSYAILEGGFGYQCYLTAPLKIVRCAEPALQQLLLDLDLICCDDGEGRSILCRQHRPGDFILDGMGGGRILDDIWVHPQLIAFALNDGIRDVLLGRKPRLSLSDEEIKALRAKWRSPDENQKYDNF